MNALPTLSMSKYSHKRCNSRMFTDWMTVVARRKFKIIAMSRFENIIDPPPDAAFALVEAYSDDTFPHKVDLCPGFYRDETARPWILPSVAQVSYSIPCRGPSNPDP